MRNSDPNRDSVLLPLFGLLLLVSTTAGLRAAAQQYTVTHLAGSPSAEPGWADGTGSTARFVSPRGMAADAAGNLYVADTGNHVIRRVTPEGVVTTLAGLAGSPGTVDGTGSAARFDSPSGVAVDVAGTVYVADTGNHTVRKVAPGGVVTTLAGLAGTPGTGDGTGSVARFSSPIGLAVSGTGGLYVTMGSLPEGSDGGQTIIRKVTQDGVVTTSATVPLPDSCAYMVCSEFPGGAAIDPYGNVIVTARLHYWMTPMTWGNRGFVRKAAELGSVSVLAEWQDVGGCDVGTWPPLSFTDPRGVAVEGLERTLVADAGCHTIRRATAAGVVSTLLGLSGSPGNHDGIGSAARFRSPWGVVVDAAGTVYVADTGNHAIRKGIVPPLATAFYALTPCRVVDTRGPDGPLGGPALAAGQIRTILVSPTCGIPATARSISANVTVTGSTAPGSLSFFPGGAVPPLTSTINFAQAQTRANNSILELALDGAGTLSVQAGTNGPVHLILDVTGYFE